MTKLHERFEKGEILISNIYQNCKQNTVYEHGPQIITRLDEYRTTITS